MSQQVPVEEDEYRLNDHETVFMPHHDHPDFKPGVKAVHHKAQAEHTENRPSQALPGIRGKLIALGMIGTTLVCAVTGVDDAVRTFIDPGHGYHVVRTALELGFGFHLARSNQDIFKAANNTVTSLFGRTHIVGVRMPHFFE